MKAYQMAVGTDLSSSILERFLAMGRTEKELRCAVDAGMTLLEAIEAATANAPSTLRPLAPLLSLDNSGEGYDADLTALSTNPLNDIDIFSDPENITHVWKGGVLFKSPDLLITLV